MKKITFALLFTILIVHSYGSSVATASVKNELFKMTTSELFGESEDPNEESKDVEEFEIQHTILLSKIALQIRRSRKSLFADRGIELKKYIDSTATTIQISNHNYSFGDLFFSFVPAKSMDSKQKEDFVNALTEFIKTCTPHSTFEKRLLNHEKWFFQISEIPPSLNMKAGDYELTLEKDFSCTLSSTDIDIFSDDFENDDSTIYGFWEIWNGKILRFYFSNYESVPFVKQHTVSNSQRAEWYIKSAKPDFFQLQRAR